MKETLMLSHLQKAIATVKEAIDTPHKDKLARDGTIQRFEYTYELCWKILQRYLTFQLNVEFDSKKDMFREAGKLNLIDNVESWISYLEARNLMTHTYNEEVAERVYNIIPQFHADAEKLYQKLLQKSE